MVAESNEPLSQSVFAGLCSMFVAFNSIVPYECMNVNTKADICMIYFVEGVFMDISRIVELAKKQGKTMAHLCRLLGKTRSYLNDVRRGACVLPYNSIEIIAADLGTTPEYLFKPPWIFQLCIVQKLRIRCAVSKLQCFAHISQVG